MPHTLGGPGLQQFRDGRYCDAHKVCPGRGSVAINHPRACRPTLGLFVHARPRSRVPARPFGRPFWRRRLRRLRLRPRPWCPYSVRLRPFHLLLVIRVSRTYTSPPGAKLSLRSTPTRQIVLSHFRRAGLCVRTCVRQPLSRACAGGWLRSIHVGTSWLVDRLPSHPSIRPSHHHGDGHGSGACLPACRVAGMNDGYLRVHGLWIHVRTTAGRG